MSNDLHSPLKTTLENSFCKCNFTNHIVFKNTVYDSRIAWIRFANFRLNFNPLIAYLHTPLACYIDETIPVNIRHFEYVCYPPMINHLILWPRIIPHLNLWCKNFNTLIFQSLDCVILMKPFSFSATLSSIHRSQILEDDP